MPKQIKVPVPGGIVGHGRSYTEVVLREPTYREYLDLGDVTEFVIYPNGMRIPTVNNEVVGQYIDACLVEPKDPLLLEQGGMALAKALRGVVFGFFRDEPPEGAASGTSASSSSGAPARDVSAPAT